MQLIACPVCHAQYDVSHVDAARFDCRCGESLENRPLTPVDAAVSRCGSCGAHVPLEHAHCGYCGSEIVRDPGKLSMICPECFARNAEDSRFCVACGVAFNPEALPQHGVELPCPACESLMPPSHVGGIAVNECAKCHGLWVGGDAFDALVKRAVRAAEARHAGHDAPRVTGANPARQSLRYRRCPECSVFMLRVNYQRSSGVILDECRDHGSWLDADELEQVAGFLLSGGGRPTARSDSDERLNREAAAAMARARMASQQTSFGGGLGAPIGGRSLLSLFLDLLD